MTKKIEKSRNHIKMRIWEFKFLQDQKLLLHCAFYLWIKKIAMQSSIKSAKFRQFLLLLFFSDNFIGCLLFVLPVPLILINIHRRYSKIFAIIVDFRVYHRGAVRLLFCMIMSMNIIIECRVHTRFSFNWIFRIPALSWSKWHEWSHYDKTYSALQ